MLFYNYNHGQIRPFLVLAHFSFTKSEWELGYYHQDVNVWAAERVKP